LERVQSLPFAYSFTASVTGEIVVVAPSLELGVVAARDEIRVEDVAVFAWYLDGPEVLNRVVSKREYAEITPEGPKWIGVRDNTWQVCANGI